MLCRFVMRHEKTGLQLRPELGLTSLQSWTKDRAIGSMRTIALNSWSAFVTGLVVAGLCGCTSVPEGPADPSPTASMIRWPQPPEVPRIAFNSAVEGPADLGIKPPVWRRMLGVVTGYGREMEHFVKPQSVAFDESGNLCVADPAAAMVSVLDLQNSRAVRLTRIGGLKLSSPVGIARRSGITYVADSGLATVLAFNDRGHHTLTITNGLVRPSGVAVSSNRIFIADAAMHRISVFNLAGQFIRHFGQRGEKPGDFNAPTHLALGADGRIFVTDALNFRIQIFDQDGNWLGKFGSIGDGPGHLSRPKGVALDTSGRVYVVDAIFDNVQIFDVNGRLLLHWGQSGTGPGEFWLPTGIAIDSSNRIVIADAYNSRLQFFRYIGPP